jgi:crotonobetainyl-CoA:carnitine CoA-transferase CaiB-like acyl-CoA transferase
MRPAPLIGEHNEYVLREILGLSDDDIADLIIEGVITTDDDLPNFQISVN